MFLFEGHLVLAVRIILHDMNEAYCSYCLVLCCLFEDLKTLFPKFWFNKRPSAW